MDARESQARPLRWKCPLFRIGLKELGMLPERRRLSA
jgi:hypothetical protein